MHVQQQSDSRVQAAVTHDAQSSVKFYDISESHEL